MGFTRMRCGIVAIIVALIAGALSATALASGLPSVSSGHRPGPDILYSQPADAPQLQNTGPWRAAPILVSGASSYRDGEWLYQDFIYDDHGAEGVADANNPVGTGPFLYAAPGGTFTYPTDAAYANNAADLVELRVKPLGDSTAFRVTLNTLQDPNRAAFTIALGGTPGVNVPWPHGAGISSPAALFLTWHGGSAELINAVTHLPVGPAPSVSVDTQRRQIDVRVPHAAWDPGGSTVRMTIGTGLWDPGSGAYLVPKPGQATATTPGGGTPTGVAIFNVGPRFNEPYHDYSKPGLTLADTAVTDQINTGWWRDELQGSRLALGDASSFSANVDFGKLAAGARDDSNVPSTGSINRILASHYQFGQGLDPSKVCFDLASNFSAGARCIGRLVGQLQPYALYVPARPQPSGGWGLTLLLHSLSANQNQYSASRNQSEVGERGVGSLVATPSGRGPDGFYAGIAEADTFEVWADVARHYDLDPGWTDVSGYSMGGFGTYRLLARWPDLFARGFSVVGAPGTADPQLPSLRNTPLMAWNAGADELVPLTQSEAAEQHLAATGVRFVEWLFPGSDHLGLASNDEYGPGVAFLGTDHVDRSPPHVTYVVNPPEDSATAAAVADHAYWVSAVALRSAAAAPTGTIDMRSEAFGVGDPPQLPVTQGAGTLNGGYHGPMPYISRERDWGRAPSTPKHDTIDIHATNVRAATFDPRRARVDCNVLLNVTTDGPITITISGCGELSFSAGHSSKRLRRLTVRVHPARARAGVRTTFVFTVLNGRRPVAHATVVLLGRRARTGRRGRAVIRLALPRARIYVARVRARGFRNASVRIRGLRRAAAPRFTG